jgi:hypothetical protein
LLVMALLFVACSNGHAAPASQCATAVQERLDPRSTLHLFPGAAEPTYTSDPPTSGPHRLGSHPSGVVDNPIARPVQVAMLEAGDVLVQYRDPRDRAALVALASGHVTVAPNGSLAAPVVATAWTWKLTCRGPDVAALRTFARRHVGSGGPRHTT